MKVDQAANFVSAPVVADQQSQASIRPADPRHSRWKSGYGVQMYEILKQAAQSGAVTTRAD